MMPQGVASRSKLGHAYKQLKFLSPRARKLLSVLFAAGLVFFALLSLSIYVKDPDTNNVKRPARVASKERRALSISNQRDVSRHLVQSASGTDLPRTPLRLLLATHGRLFWYHPENGTSQVLHEGEGVHYGVFPGEVTASGELKTVWNVIRPHNWHPTTSQEYLVQMDAETGHEVNRIRIKSRFTHDAVRRGDKVYLANTEEGEVKELQFPEMKQLRAMRLFTLRQHVNTLAPLDDGMVWAVLHNLGRSAAVKIDPNADPRPRVVHEIKGVGTNAHGLVLWRELFVMLDSENGALVTVDPNTGQVQQRWKHLASEGPAYFLKGLCVVDDVAYFGVNVWGERATRDSATNNAELAAVDLTTGALLWRRTVPSHGLLNVVAAPQLGEASTYKAMASGGGVDTGVAAAARRAASEEAAGQASAADAAADGSGSGSGSGSKGAGQRGGGRGGVATGINDPHVIEATRQLVGMGYKPKTTSHWASGQPRLDLPTKDSPRSWEAGISLPLMQVNIDKLRDLVTNMPDDMWSPARQRRENAAVDGRKDNMNMFKPGVEALYMVFSDQSTEHVYRFPYYDYFKDAIEPLLEEIVGRADMNKVVRLQFARMKPGTHIKPHKDMGGYARFAHRIHLPVVTHPNVSFQVCPQAELGGARKMGKPEPDCLKIPMSEGMVFELNNRVMHQVDNYSNVKRVQLVVDVAEEPRAPRRLKPGTVCMYQNAVMVCPADRILGAAA